MRSRVSGVTAALHPTPRLAHHQRSADQVSHPEWLRQVGLSQRRLDQVLGVAPVTAGMGQEESLPQAVGFRGAIQNWLPVRQAAG